MVAGLAEIEFTAVTGAHGGEHGLNFGVAHDSVDAGFLDIEDLPAQRQNGLNFGVAPLFGRAAGGVPFHQEQLADAGILAGAVGELPGEGGFFQGVAFTGGFSGFARRFSGAEGLGGFVDDFLGHFGMFLKIGGEEFRDDGVYRRGDVAVAQLRFGLSLKLGFQHLNGDHRRHAFADIFAAEVLVVGL